jgi:hypothetical protein
VRLETVLDSFAKLATLKTLWLEGCNNLIEHLVEFSNLYALDSLNLENNVNGDIN